MGDIGPENEYFSILQYFHSEDPLYLFPLRWLFFFFFYHSKIHFSISLIAKPLCFSILLSSLFLPPNLCLSPPLLFLNPSSFPPRTSSLHFHFIMFMPFCLTLCILLSRSLYLPLSAAIPHCFPKGFTLKLRENIQAWNSPERVLNAHLLFHFQDETRALILKNPVCPDGSLRQRCLHPSLAFSSFPVGLLACSLPYST